MILQRILGANTTRRLMMGIVVAALSLLAFVGTARATATVWFYPPVGTWYSFGNPSGSAFAGCFTFAHTLETRTYRVSGADNIYIYYYYHRNGSASMSGLWWRNLWLADGGTGPYDSEYVSAPNGTLYTSGWYVLFGRYFNNEPGCYAYGETRFGDPGADWCQGMSWGVYGPY